MSVLGNMFALIQNETIKMLKKKRLYVVLLIIMILIPIFSYAQLKIVETTKDKFQKNWRLELQQTITDTQNSLSSHRIPEEWKKFRRVQLQQLQYYLEHDVNPQQTSGLTFTRMFMDKDSTVKLFIPLLIMAFASDIVSGERAAGTMKMLLVRPVRRWKILLSKLLAMLMFVSLIIVMLYMTCYVVAGAMFGYTGFNMPMFTGFQTRGTEIDVSNVYVIAQWKYVLMQAGLVWFVSSVVAILSFMVSVLVKSTAASIVIMMSSLIGGIILTNITSSWQAAKYLFMVNLGLTTYLNGNMPPIEGMGLSFSLVVLSLWCGGALLVSFFVFTEQDMMN